jgi:hypothetical protein
MPSPKYTFKIHTNTEKIYFEENDILFKNENVPKWTEMHVIRFDIDENIRSKIFDKYDDFNFNIIPFNTNKIVDDDKFIDHTINFSNKTFPYVYNGIFAGLSKNFNYSRVNLKNKDVVEFNLFFQGMNKETKIYETLNMNDFTNNIFAEIEMFFQ